MKRETNGVRKMMKILDVEDGKRRMNENEETKNE